MRADRGASGLTLPLPLPSGSPLTRAARGRERTLLDDLLLKTIPLVNEANLISDELGRGMRFSIKLLARGTLGSSSAQEPVVRGPTRATFLGTASLTHSLFPVAAQEKKLAVRTEEGSGSKLRESMWTYEQFTERLYAMRELYQRYEEAEDDPTVLEEVPPEEDPFRAVEEDVLIGKALVFLEPLGHLIDVDERVPIIDYRGMEKGQLVLSITPQALDFEDRPVRGRLARWRGPFSPAHPGRTPPAAGHGRPGGRHAGAVHGPQRGRKDQCRGSAGLAAAGGVRVVRQLPLVCGRGTAAHCGQHGQDDQPHLRVRRNHSAGGHGRLLLLGHLRHAGVRGVRALRPGDGPPAPHLQTWRQAGPLLHPCRRHLGRHP